MNTHRNLLKVVAGVLLMASLPAGAQVLGGSIGGVANGAFGAGLGGTEIGGAGSVAGNAGFGASGVARERGWQVGSKARHVAGSATATARSQVESTRATTDAAAAAGYSAGVQASHRAARSAARTGAGVEQDAAAQTSARPEGDLYIGGSSGASSEQHAAGHSIAARGVAGSHTASDRNELRSSTYGGADLSVKKDERTAPETPAE